MRHGDVAAALPSQFRQEGQQPVLHHAGAFPAGGQKIQATAFIGRHVRIRIDAEFFQGAAFIGAEVHFDQTLFDTNIPIAAADNGGGLPGPQQGTDMPLRTIQFFGRSQPGQIPAALFGQGDVGPSGQAPLAIPGRAPVADHAQQSHQSAAPRTAAADATVRCRATKSRAAFPSPARS